MVLNFRLVLMMVRIFGPHLFLNYSGLEEDHKTGFNLYLCYYQA